VTSDAVGRLFEPDDPEDLARAMGEALELSDTDGTAAACRKRARAYSWSESAARYEELYAAAAEGQVYAAPG
jgi:glycogen synthase